MRILSHFYYFFFCESALFRILIFSLYFQTYQTCQEGYKQKKFDEEYRASSSVCKALEKKIKEKMKENRTQQQQQEQNEEN